MDAEIKKAVRSVASYMRQIGLGNHYYFNYHNGIVYVTDSDKNLVLVGNERVFKTFFGELR